MYNGLVRYGAELSVSTLPNQGSRREDGPVKSLPKSELLDNLRRAGFADAAADLDAELPDVVDLDQCRPLLEKHGVTLGGLEEALGSSP
jgi:hypothetical protein